MAFSHNGLTAYSLALEASYLVRRTVVLEKNKNLLAAITDDVDAIARNIARRPAQALGAAAAAHAGLEITRLPHGDLGTLLERIGAMLNRLAG